MNCGTLKGWEQHKAANTPACQYCKSAKAKHDAGTLVIAPVRSKAQVAQCGTVSGYKKHRRNGEAACAKCREAANEYSRFQKARKRGTTGTRTGRPVSRDCGTVAAYVRHRRAGEEPCEPCAEASRVDAKNRYREARAKKLGIPVEQVAVKNRQGCGTMAAYARHKRNGEEPDDACRQAMRDTKRNNRIQSEARKKAEAAQ